MLSPLERRAQRKDKGIAGRKAEVSLSKRIRAELRPGSGAIDSAKGDMTKADFLIENKSAVHSASFSVRRDHLHKIYQEALELGKSPALAFQLVNSGGQSDKRDRWVCIPEHLFQEMVGDL